MRVCNINNCYCQKPYNAQFRGISREVYKNNQLKYRNNSWMFRPDLPICKQFYDFLYNFFKNIDKVNVYNYACSLGYEAYSFIMGMFARSEKDFEKFMPVIAKDCDKMVINKTRNHIIPLTKCECGDITEIFDSSSTKYAEFIEFTDSDILDKKMFYKIFGGLEADGYTMGILKDKLIQNVKYSVRDIRKDYKNIKPENSVVLATNFWPYLPAEDRVELARNLSKHLKKNCFVKLDDYDEMVNAPNLLLSNGFKKTPVLNLFSKGV